MNKVAVIILNYNTWMETIKEVELVQKQFGLTANDIIVVDNCSSNESYEELSKVAEGKFTLLLSNKNNGYAAGNNIGLRYVYKNGYDYAWILNNDILFNDKELIHKLSNLFQKDNMVAVVNPDIYATDGHMFNRDAVRPTFYDFTFGILQYRKKGRNIKDLGGYGYVYRPQGCCMMVDLKKLAEVGFMDEHTFLYNEELILAERLLKKNYRCICCLTASIVHNHSYTIKTFVEKKQITKIKMDSFIYYLKEYRNYSVLKQKICCLFNRLKLAMLK